jgi:2-methylcitrate dehydratase PrpD
VLVFRTRTTNTQNETGATRWAALESARGAIMAAEQNPFATAPDTLKTTAAAAAFVASVSYEAIPAEALRIGTRCLLDGLGLFVAGAAEHSVEILADEAEATGGKPEALLLGRGAVKVPAPMAARVLGAAGHAHDWDDSQVSKDPAHVYGLLTHPTIPPLTSALALAQKLGAVDGKAFMLAFLTGFEVECKISEWMLPQHYLRGMHSSATVGTFGAYAAAAKLLDLKDDKLRSGFGIAASFVAGIRCNFGTMTKPLHVGRAAENGITAALLAERGFSADPDALDGPWGFFAVHGGGVSAEKTRQGFGQTWSIVEPGVSIKPYPCGVLTHPTIDLMLKLVVDNDVQPENIEAVKVYAGTNILNPIRYPVAANHLQAKFSLSAALAMIVLARRAGKREFSDAFVASAAMQSMQRKITTEADPEIEKMGFDKMRSRITIRLRDGRSIDGWADERYRGGPDNPMTDGEVEDKARSCCDGVLDERAQSILIDAAWGIARSRDAGELMKIINGVNP